MKRMALVLLFGSVLGFASTVLVSFALGSESISQPSEGLPKPGEGISKPTEVVLQPSEVVLDRRSKFPCNYATYTPNGVDFQLTKYVVCFRRGTFVVEPASAKDVHDVWAN